MISSNDAIDIVQAKRMLVCIMKVLDLTIKLHSLCEALTVSSSVGPESIGQV